MSTAMNGNTLSDYVVSDMEGDIVAWASTIPAIRRRLRRSSAGVVYTASGGMLGRGGLTAKRTPMLRLLRSVDRTQINLRYASVTLKDDLLSFRFPTGSFHDVLIYVGAFLSRMGGIVEYVDSMLLEVRLPAEVLALFKAECRRRATNG